MSFITQPRQHRMQEWHWSAWPLLTADSSYYLNVTGHSADSSTPRITPERSIVTYNYSHQLHVHVYTPCTCISPALSQP